MTDDPNHSAQTTGDQSPIIFAEGDVNVTYINVPKKLQDYWVSQLELNKYRVIDIEAELASLKNSYSDLLTKLERRSPEEALSKQAKEELEGGNLETAGKLLEKSFDTNNKKARESATAAAEDALSLAQLHALQLNYKKAQEWYNSAVEKVPENAKYWVAAGANAIRIGDEFHKRFCFSEVIRLLTDAQSTSPEDEAQNFYLMGVASQSLGVHRDALEYFKKAHRACPNHFKREPRHDFALRNNMGRSYDALKDHNNALACYKKSLACSIRSNPEDKETTASCWNNIGTVLADMKKWRKSIDCYERSLTIYEKLGYKDEHPQKALTLGNIGSSWARLGKKKKALSFCKRAHSGFLKTLGPLHPLTLSNEKRVASLS